MIEAMTRDLERFRTVRLNRKYTLGDLIRLYQGWQRDLAKVKRYRKNYIASRSKQQRRSTRIGGAS